MEEYQTDDSNGKMGWFWNKGGSVWKKLLVAGFMVMSAPLFLPPLVVASTIVVLSSIPYGLFLATYACTEKLMSALLPSTASPSLLLNDGGVDETRALKKEPGGFEGHPDEHEGEQRMIGIKGGGLTEEDQPEPATDEESSDVTRIAVELHQSTVIPEDEELARETRSLNENIRDEGKLDEGNKGPTDEVNEKQPGKEDKILGESDKNSEKNKSEEIQGKDTKDIGPSENKTKVPVEGTKATDEQTPAATEGISAHSSSRKEGSDEVRSKCNLTVDEKSNQYHHPKLLMRQEELVKRKEKSLIRKRGKPDVQVLAVSEAKLWEKIDAVRIITGYKVARNSAFVEEIKALYLFTGVEPLVSFKDETDMAEASHKLRFLMSVVGIK